MVGCGTKLLLMLGSWGTGWSWDERVVAVGGVAYVEGRG